MSENLRYYVQILMGNRIPVFNSHPCD